MTVFVIIGLVLIIIIALVFFARNNMGVGVDTQVFLEGRLDPIKDNIQDCTDQIVPAAITALGKQGGDFSPASYRRYQSYEVKYYCLNIQGEDTCLNIMPTAARIRHNLQDYIDREMNNCIDRSLTKSRFGYSITQADPKTTVEFKEDTINVNIDYPVKIQKGGTTVAMPEVKRVFNDVPLNALYDTALDITNSLATTGFFDQVTYMLNNKADVIIEVDKPYPDTIYMLHTRGGEYQFWFAIEGEEMAIL